MKNFVPRLVNGVALFAAGGLAVVAGEALLITKAAGKITDSDIVEGALIPWIKNYICDGAEKLFFGTTRREKDREPKVRYSQRPSNYINYATLRPLDFEFDTYEDAKDFYHDVMDEIDAYGFITVSKSERLV